MPRRTCPLQPGPRILSPGTWLFAALAALSPACAGGEGRGDAASTAAPGPTGTDSTGADSTGTAGSTEPDTTGDDPPTSSSSSSTSEGVDDPPLVCDPLTTCGVQCVDLMTDAANCGKCGVSCVIPRATAACAAGQCALGECDDGWFDCDEDPNTGCEQQLAPGQMCGLVCKPDKAEACNLFDDNCDGQCDEGALPGCRVGVHRCSSPTLGHFYTIDAAEAMSGDFTPEFLNFYYLYSAPGAGLVPFYRCLKGDGRRFYTTSGTCENAATLEGPLGHIATDPQCGAVPLFRLYGAGDHFYTTSEAERDNAVAMYGYQYEAVAGYVWTGP
ncbi:hypothetical protein [Nannocystis punicea]|uniref:DUF5648 domain-containing protein n=1 Tax=Nannocystis punicea TaxID=2995304 RepID=A0ABY7GTA3_9BACT|nr:hypothetical protein [Nannocystis poenicansa]WAS90194.1 hypothetical protein O0S08_28705 [Nannocystis poenicansa]